MLCGTYLNYFYRSVRSILYCTGRSTMRRKEDDSGELENIQMNLNAIHEGW